MRFRWPWGFVVFSSPCNDFPKKCVTLSNSCFWIALSLAIDEAVLSVDLARAFIDSACSLPSVLMVQGMPFRDETAFPISLFRKHFPLWWQGPQWLFLCSMSYFFAAILIFFLFFFSFKYYKKALFYLKWAFLIHFAGRKWHEIPEGDILEFWFLVIPSFPVVVCLDILGICGTFLILQKIIEFI